MWKADIAKTTIAVNNFRKTHVWQGWICQSSVYVFGSEYARVLNMAE